MNENTPETNNLPNDKKTEKELSAYKKWAPLIGALIFVAGLWTGYLLAGGDHLTPGQEKLNKVLHLIETDYVDPINSDSLIELTIPAILKNLDPHSIYIPVSDLERVNRDLESSFFGIGVQFQIMSDSICIVEVVSGGPAERVGIQPGDRIIAVDGEPMIGATNEDVLSTLRGEYGTEVVVTIKRNSSAEPLDFAITRGEIPSTSIDAAYLINDSTAYIKLSKFAPNTFHEFFEASHDLRARGAENFIIDLRGNPGGLLDQAILISNELLEPGRTIVSVKGRDSRTNENWRADGTGTFTGGQLVVLVDEFSASCSEILAGAVQDNDRGLIVGRRTFGKGLVQRQIELPDSSQMRLTVQRYYTPSGRSIQKDYTGGEDAYEKELLDRFSNGEIFSADSTKLNLDKVFDTANGRKVYGGGGIMPDVFVPSDTTGLTSYYFKVVDAGLLQKFAYEYADLNREQLSQAKTPDELVKMLPARDVLLWAFVKYAADNGVPQRWYYINISSNLIVNQLRALIARDILGMGAYYQLFNRNDAAVKEALKQINEGVKSKLTPITR